MSKQANNNDSIYNFFFKVGFFSRRTVKVTRVETAAKYVGKTTKSAVDGVKDGWAAGEVELNANDVEIIG